MSEMPLTDATTELAMLSSALFGPRTSLRDLLARPGTRVVLLAGSKDPNAKCTMLLMDDAGPSFAIKIPTTSAAAESLHSACHGAGTVIADLKRKGLSGPHPDGHTTLRFRYSDAAPSEVAHLDDLGVNAALDVLARHGLVRPVARLRPFAVLN